MIDAKDGSIALHESDLKKVYLKSVKKDVHMVYNRLAKSPQLENNRFRFVMLTLFNTFFNLPGAAVYIWYTRLRLISVIFEQEKNVLQMWLSDDLKHIMILNHHKRQFEFAVENVKMIHYSPDNYDSTNLGSIFIICNNDHIFELHLQTGFQIKYWLLYALFNPKVTRARFAGAQPEQSDSQHEAEEDQEKKIEDLQK